MIDNNEHIADLFSCVLQYGSKDSEIFFQFSSIDAEQLLEGIWLNLYQVIVEYYRKTITIIEEEELNIIIDDTRLSEEEKEKYKQLFSDLRKRKVKKEAFNFYIHRLKNKVLRDKSYVMLVKANQALTSKLKVGKNTFTGYKGMKRLLTETMYSIDRIVAEYSPEGDVNQETDEVLDEYKKIKVVDDNILTGFSKIDKCTGGLYPGELWLWAGYAAEGKTFSCINIGYHAAYIQRKNVLYLTSETVRSVVRRRLISRHALELTKRGINLTDWKKGELTDESYEALQNTLKDMKDGNKEYGVFHILQMPANADTDFVAAALTRCQALFNVDLCILDSIHLLKPKKTRQSSYAEIDDMLIEINKIIVSHNDGRGVPLISPWHTNRASWEKAKEEGIYTKSALARSGEAERSADVIITILREDWSDNQLRGSIIKNRDGEELSEFYLQCDFKHGYIGDEQIVTEGIVDLLQCSDLYPLANF
jgi:replicative DNA helicase